MYDAEILSGSWSITTSSIIISKCNFAKFAKTDYNVIILKHPSLNGIETDSYQQKVRGRTSLMARASDSGSRDPGSILGRVGVFVSLSKRHLLPQKVLAILRNRWLRLNMTEKLFTGTLNHNQNKTKTKNKK